MNTFIVLASLLACAMANVGEYDSVDHMVHPTNYGHGLAASSRYDVRHQTVAKAVVAAPALAYGGYAAAPALAYGGYAAAPAIAHAGLGYAGLGGIAVAPRTVASYGYSAVHPARAVVAAPALGAYGAYGAYHG